VSECPPCAATVKNGDRETVRSLLIADATRGHDLDLFGSLLDVGEEALYGRSEAGVVVFWNAAAERPFGYPADEVVGTTMIDSCRRRNRKPT